MPNFKLKEEDIRDMSAFLIANSTPIPGDNAPPINQKAADPTAGVSLYGESFCASCHAVQNAAGNLVGGNVGPELTRIGNKAKPEWLRAWVRNPRTYDPKTQMSHYRFTDQQVATMEGFLLAKADSDLLANVHLDPATPEQVAHGKSLVMEYGCSSCHEIGSRSFSTGRTPGRAHAHWQQAGLATDLPDWNATYSARLHCRQDTPATRILSRPEDAAVFVHSNPDRCVNHRTPGTKRSCAIHAVRTRSARTSSFTLSACWKSRTDHGRPRLL